MSCNLQFFSELITTQLRDVHKYFPLPIYLTMQSYKFYLLSFLRALWSYITHLVSYASNIAI